MKSKEQSAEPQCRDSFKLTRYFSGTSLVGITLVTACLIWTYHQLSVRHLVAHEGRANANLTRAFANTVWGRYREFVFDSAHRTRQELLADPVTALIRSEVLVKMQGLPVVKLKIYNLDGMTVFSTDESQIGDDKSSNEGFLAARAGAVASNITYREKFDAFEGTLSNRNLIASYVPIYSDNALLTEGVFEVYSDVTELLNQQSAARWEIAGIVLAMLATLYFFLFLVVRKADSIIACQEIQRDAKEEEIRHQAYHDSLTGLPNRANFSKQLDESLSLTSSNGHTGTLLFIDLDRFKAVNDNLGHQAGDELLKEVALRIRGSLRKDDLAFRMGGDEFTVILPPSADAENADLVARRILEAVSAPVSIHEHEVVAGASIGVAKYPVDGETAELILKNADAALYQAKEKGRGTYAHYNSDEKQLAQQ